MMREMDVNAITGTLKLYFRELPEPLLTGEVYQNLITIIGQWPLLGPRHIRSCDLMAARSHLLFLLADLSDSAAKENRITDLLLSLPEPNLVTVRFLLEHLKR